MMVGTWDWWSGQVALAHHDGRIPHGPLLPDKMQWHGDMYVLENEDGTDTLCIWYTNGWDKGPSLKRPQR